MREGKRKSVGKEREMTGRERERKRECKRKIVRDK